MTIKESFHKDWSGNINGKNITIEPSNFGFMSFKNEEIGYCKLELNFKDPSYYSIFNVISLASITIVVLILIYKKFFNKTDYFKK